MHKVPTTGAPNTSFDKLYSGKTDGFQRTYYDFRGNVSLQIDFTYHNNPSIHSNPHLHIWCPTDMVNKLICGSGGEGYDNTRNQGLFEKAFFLSI